MNKTLFGFILQYSKQQQIMLVLLIALSYPFYYLSLDLPKNIINEAIGANLSDFPKHLLGHDLDQINFLLALCAAFLALVLINGGLKYVVNVFKGVLAERMLRRLRYSLVERVMRFPLPHFRNVSQGEVVSMITAEAEPVGGFIGDSIATPAFQGGMLVTALIFMFMQDPILGIAAIFLYPIQAWLIPKLQRQVNLLNKERVLNIRMLSERIDEIVSGAAEIHGHDTSQFELADFSKRFGKLFRIRFEIYKKKFFIKFLNNFLAQITPFFFYSIGGYLVIKGNLSIGALVAVLAAYKDLAPPWKELLNYYQRLEDAKIRYSQLIERFDVPDMYSEEIMSPSLEGGDALQGLVQASNLSVEDDVGKQLLNNASFEFNMDEHVAVIGSSGDSRSAVGKLLARQLMPSRGSITIGGNNIATVPEYITGRQLGYIDQFAYIRSGSIRDNLFYGLKHFPQAADKDQAVEGLDESKRSGNSLLDIDADWLDGRVLSQSDEGNFLSLTEQVLTDVELDGEILSMAFQSTINPLEKPELTEQIMQARQLVRERMNSNDYENLVESWDRERYNENASVGENILFGTPVDDSLDVQELGRNEFMLSVLKRVDLYDDFLEMGRGVADLMVELFQDIAPGHEYFERFSFISADDLPEFNTIVKASANEGVAALNKEQRERLIQLPFKLIKERHRLGYIDEAMEGRLLQARKVFAEEIPAEMASKISFFDRSNYSPASSVMDNVLFGKIVSGHADAAQKIQQLLASVVDELDLRLPLIEIGLDFEVGVAGRRLSAEQRQKLAIARNLIKQPELLVVNEALRVINADSREAIFAAIRKAMAGKGLVWIDDEIPSNETFDRVFVAESDKLREAAGADQPS